MNRVFMYGTLKQGQPLHYVLSEVGQDRYKYVGKGYTSTKWPLVIASEHNIPYLLDKEGDGYNIKGEVYDVDGDLLAHLDQFECYPDVYGRRKVEIIMTTVETDSNTDSKTDSENVTRPDQERTTMECWMYYLPEPSPTLLELETMEDYDSYGAHGKPCKPIYVPDKGWIGELTTPSS
ncbi:putative gamma-glutamylcyclotransferase CG2811 [Strongylocentrotus purpuratus]|uniref:Gamma-glutamylcyclotransferase family protein n=1 Tax=Strongylocentrotus purpuratus TaxID=7668 RepID=A0A7M7NIX8_STRPU|nr:putative gamma-glutamylcyclotransferase CG2811 [Strongylocentrotus purpuratus]